MFRGYNLMLTIFSDIIEHFAVIAPLLEFNKNVYDFKYGRILSSGTGKVFLHWFLFTFVLVLSGGPAAFCLTDLATLAPGGVSHHRPLV